MLKFLKAALAVVGLCVANAVFADAVEGFTSKVANLQQFSADFSQRLLDQQGELIQQSEGKIFAARPGKLRWEIAEPYPQLIVVDGEKIWRYEEDLEQVIVSPYSDSLEETPAMLLSGDVSKLADNYQISQQGDDFILEPKAADSLFLRMRVSFDDDVLAELAIEDSLGQQTIMTMSNAQANPELAAELFEFTPPEGVDVLKDG